MRQNIPKEILRGSASVALLKVAQTLLAMLAAVILARKLGPEGFGVYSFAIALVTLCSVPMKNGVTELIVREASRAIDSESWPLLRGLIRWSGWLALVYSALCVMVIIQISLWTHHSDSENTHVLVVAVLLIPFFSLMGNSAGVLRGIGLTFAAIFPDTVIRPGLLIICLLLTMVLAPNNLSPQLAMIFHVGVAAVALVVSRLTLRRKLPNEFKLNTQCEMYGRKWMTLILPFAAIGGLQVINRQMDLILLGLLRSDAEVGLYRVAVQGGMLITFGSQAINTVIAPYFSRMKALDENTQDAKRFKNLLKLTIQISIAIAVPVFLVILLWGKELLGIVFGEAFKASYIPLVLLALSNCVAASIGSLSILLNMTGHEFETLKVFGVTVAFNLVLNLILITFFGSVGAAIAAAIATVFWTFLMRHQSRKRLGFDPFSLIIRKI